MSHLFPPPQPPYAPVPPQPKRRYAPLAVVAVIAVVAAAASLVVVLASGGNKPSTSGEGTAPFGALRATETTTSTTTTTTTTRQPYVPQPADFELEVKILEQECFGSAGCLVTFRLSVAYNGGTIYDGEGPYTVVYSLTGTDDPFVGRFTLLSQYEFEASEENVSTPQGPKLTATVTEVF